MNLDQKEMGLLKDLKGQEQLCVEKYTKYAAQAYDAQLKNLFERIADVERGHLETINKIEGGQKSFNTSSSSSAQPTFSATYTGESSEKKNDAYLCSDLLSTEKHASHLYDTCIFEFKDESLRKVLNDIQSEEQGHGKMIFDYMKANSMYS